MIRPAQRGLNATLLEQEAKLKAFMGELLNSLTGGYNEQNTMPAGPPAPFNPLRGAKSIQARPSFTPDSGYGAPSKGAFGLDTFAPNLAAAFTGRMPNEQSASSPYMGQLPEVKQPNVPAAMNGALPPEIMQLVEQMINPAGGMGKSNSAAGMPIGPPRMAQAGRSAPIRPRVKAPIQQPETFVPEPFDLEDAPANLAAFMGPQKNLTNRVPETFEPEPFDMGPEQQSLYSDSGPSPFDTSNTDEYLSHLRERPRHDDYPGSKGRNILSGVMKALFGGDFGVGDAPHEKALRSWRDKGSGLKEAAAFEQTGLKEERLRRKDTLTAENKQKELELKIKKELNDVEQYGKTLSFLKDKEEARRLMDIRKAAAMEKMSGWREEIARGRLTNDNTRTSAYSRSVNRPRVERPLPKHEQESIDKEARRIARNDPRLAKWYNPETDEFNDIPELDKHGNQKLNKDGTKKYREKMDPATREMVARELAKHKEEVARRRRQSYIYKSGFPNPFDTPDDEEEDFLNEP